ncbi:MAG TPA: polysaccharide biosynthesis/export family protein [Pseudolabrys sp.]|jgi:polysaccharide export outer membrane protein
MREFRFLLALGVALAAAGCARQQQTYYVIDPQTGQPVPVVAQQPQQQPYAPLQYPQQASTDQSQYAQPAYQQQAQPQQQYAQSSNRGLFSSSPSSAQQSYAQQSYQQPTYQQPAPQSAPSSGRGLFNSRSSTPAYAPQPAYQQDYAPQTAAPQTAAPQYGAGGPYVAAPAASYAAAPSTYQPVYTLDSGDKLRIVVFGQDGITNSYVVGADGSVNLPLVGSVPARGFSTQQLSQMISERLKQGYVREPHVSVEVDTYRPFFILGEVTTPGQYPYVANMTAETAIAIAGGFSPRADKRTIEITRNAPGQQFRGNVPLAYPLRPGDTIVVKERWF